MLPPSTYDGIIDLVAGSLSNVSFSDDLGQCRLLPGSPNPKHLENTFSNHENVAKSLTT